MQDFFVLMYFYVYLSKGSEYFFYLCSFPFCWHNYLLIVLHIVISDTQGIRPGTTQTTPGGCLFILTSVHSDSCFMTDFAQLFYLAP